MEVTNPEPPAQQCQTTCESLGVPLCSVNIREFDPFRIDYLIPFRNAKMKERHLHDHLLRSDNSHHGHWFLHGLAEDLVAELDVNNRRHIFLGESPWTKIALPARLETSEAKFRRSLGGPSVTPRLRQKASPIRQEEPRRTFTARLGRARPG
jgi:hypothetical protein